MAEARRRAAEQRGRTGEAIAAGFLRLKGYRILARRVRTPVGEIDLVVRKAGIVAFVEVKARKQADVALASVPPASWQRIACAAEYWMARRPAYADYGWRYDLIAIMPGRWPVHLRDAWRPGLA